MDAALVTVRTASTRLPGKCFLEISPGIRVIDHVLDRIRHFDLEPIVSTTRLEEDDEIALLCHRRGIRVCRGSVEDKIERWRDTCDLMCLDRFITVDCDDPFFDRNLSLQSLDILESGGWDVVSPPSTSYVGSVGFSVAADVLRRTCDTPGRSVETEMFWKYLHPRTRTRQQRTVSSTVESQMRLTLDYEEDLWLLRTVYRELGPLCSRSTIVDFFQGNPGLTRVNSFRQAEWKHRQDES